MQGSRTLVLVGAVLLLSVAAHTQSTPARGYKAVHLFNVAPADETQLLRGLSELSGAVAAAGVPDVQYRVWKVQGEAQGSHAYIWESTWPDRATYDKVHNNPEYKKVQQKVEPLMGRLLRDHVYNRYSEVALPKP